MVKARSWEVSGEFWMRVEPHIPKRRWSEAGVYKRGPGGGRKPMDPRKVFEDMAFVLRTGCQWRALPGNGGALTARNWALFLMPRPCPANTKQALSYRPTKAQWSAGSGGYRPARLGPESQPEEAATRPPLEGPALVVEVANFWFNRLRKLLVRHEKFTDGHAALLHVAAAIICRRKVAAVYGISS